MHACKGPDLGTSAAPPELGVGGGMCWAALDRYLRGVEIPRDTRSPAAGDPLHTELLERQVAAVAGLWPRIGQWQSAPAGSWRDRLPFPVPFGGRDVASRVRAEWRELRRRLDADQPVLLTLLLEGGAYDRPRTIRQVLATGWSRNGSRVTLSIYDPDRPEDDDVDLLFSLSGRLNARLTGGTPIRGFFPVAYDRSPAPTVRVQRFDDRSVIGLNRTIRGEPATAAGRRHVDLVARNERGALLHFRRVRDGTWEGSNVMEAERLEAHEIHCDPVAVHQTGALHVFARDYAGDLLHFRKGRSWSVTNCTDQKRAGAQFRVVGRPVALEGPKLQLSVIGRDTDGGVVHYQYVPIRGWRAEQVPGDPVAGDPLAIRDEDIIHVGALATDGRLLHWARDEAWTMTDSDAGPGPAVRLQGRPAMVLLDGRVHVIGRGRHNRLIFLGLGDDGLWQRKAMAGNLAGDPGIAFGPGGLHVLAPTADGGLIHAWRDRDEWTSENVVESRATLAPGSDPSGQAGVAVWGTHRTLRAFVHREDRLRVYSWTPDADWVCDPVPGPAGTPPMAFRDSDDEPHLVFTDGRGTLVHVGTGAWREPGRHGEAAETLAVAGAAAERAVADDAGHADGDEALPVVDEEPVVEETPGLDRDELDTDRAEDEPIQAEPAAAAQTDGTEPDPVEEPMMDLGVEDLEGWNGAESAEAEYPTAEAEAAEHPTAELVEAEPLTAEPPEPEDADAGTEPSQEVLDFEAERLVGRDPEPEPDAAPDPEPEEPMPGEQPEPEPDEAVAEVEMETGAETGTATGAEGEDDVASEEGAGAESEEGEDWDARPPAGLPGLPGAAAAEADAGATADDWEPHLEMAEETEPGEGDPKRTKRTERPVRKFRWEERKPALSADDVEPMDLSLLDSWPPPSRGTRRDRSKDRENGDGTDD